MNFISRPSFWIPKFFASSGWIQHAPFAFWLIDVLRPRSFVELGTHHGYSYFVVNQAVQDLGLKTHCTAIDTWQGDEHAGFYGDEVFTAVSEYNANNYCDQSELMRCTFEDAVGRFSDASIDLLHIDGRHLYSDVKRDYETWRRKVSPSGVILFHDTSVRVNGFGVSRFWEELSGEFPNFEFSHGHGLGVVGFGPEVPQLLQDLFSASKDPKLTTEVRATYARLGESLTERYRLDKFSIELDKLSRGHAQTLESTVRDVNHLKYKLEAATQAAVIAEERAKTSLREINEIRQMSEREINEVREQLQIAQETVERNKSHHLAERDLMIARFGAEMESLRSEMAELQSESAELQSELADKKALKTRLAELQEEQSRLIAECSRLKYFEGEYHLAVTSASWKISGPLRAASKAARKCASLFQQAK